MDLYHPFYYRYISKSVSFSLHCYHRTMDLSHPILYSYIIEVCFIFLTWLHHITHNHCNIHTYGSLLPRPAYMVTIETMDILLHHCLVHSTCQSLHHLQTLNQSMLHHQMHSSKMTKCYHVYYSISYWLPFSSAAKYA